MGFGVIGSNKIAFSRTGAVNYDLGGLVGQIPEGLHNAVLYWIKYETLKNAKVSEPLEFRLHKPL